MAEALLEKLTRTEQFWYRHARQADQSEQSLIEYARAHELNVNAFYNYRSVLRGKGLLNSSSSGSFVKAKLQSEGPKHATLILLPNGIRIETDCIAGALVEWVKGLCG